MAPPSPACGLRPATAMRGDGDAKLGAFRPAAVIAMVSRNPSGVSTLRDVGQGNVDGGRHHPQLRAGEHHYNAGPALRARPGIRYGLG